MYISSYNYLFGHKKVTLAFIFLQLEIVSCDDNSTSVSNIVQSGTFRLTDGDIPSEGRVEVYFSGS